MNKGKLTKDRKELASKSPLQKHCKSQKFSLATDSKKICFFEIILQLLYFVSERRQKIDWNYQLLYNIFLSVGVSKMKAHSVL